MTKGWERYYTERTARLGPDEYLSQVGHTVNGRPISDHQFQLLLDQIRQSLDLTQSDHLLDVCCGNGLFTQRLAAEVSAVVGVDLSAPLIDIARKAHGAENIAYFQLDAAKLGDLDGNHRGPFDKIVMYAALQHFAPSEFERVLDQMLDLAAPEATIMLGFVPDRALKWRFYDTWKRRAEHVWRTMMKRELLGTWWSREALERMCQKRGLTCRFEELPTELHAANYRFNAVLRHEAAGPGA